MRAEFYASPTKQLKFSDISTSFEFFYNSENSTE